MGIQFETDYNMETLTAMAKGLRKTVRKKRSRRVHIFAAVVLVLGILTILATVAGGEPLGASGVVTLLAMLVVILVSLFEDRLNAWLRKSVCCRARSTPPPRLKRTATFRQRV